MIEQLLVHQVWLAIVLCGGSYISDYYLTIYTARLYQAKASEHFSFGGSIELTPYYQQDVDQLRRWSPRFAIALLLLVIGVFVVWLLSVVVLKLPAFFLFLVGGLFLREVTIHMRHVRNIALFRYARDTSGVKGRVEYARWLPLRLSAVEFATYALFFLGCALIAPSWFFAGGAIACSVIALQHRQLTRKAAASEPDTDSV